MIELSLASTD